MEVELWEMEERRTGSGKRRSSNGRPRNGRVSEPIVPRSPECVLAAAMGAACIALPILFGVVGFPVWAFVVAIGGFMLGCAVTGALK